MHSLTKFLIVAGVLCFALALLWELVGRRLGLSRLPGDVAVERGNVRFYFPIVSCLVLSVVLTLVVNLILRWLGK